MSTKTAGGIKKIAASKSRKPAPKVETMQTLKDQTDKYFAIREAQLDSREIAKFAIHKLAHYGIGEITQDSLETDCDIALAKWDDALLAPTPYELGQLLIEDLNHIQVVIGQLSHLKFDRRNEPRNPSGFLSQAVHNEGVRLAKEMGIVL